MKRLRMLLVLASCSAFSCLVGCGGGSHSTTPNVITTTGNNVAAITVNSGPPGNDGYVNGGFTSVTVCTPGTSTCQTIDGILVDTGSSGLRILSSLLPALTQENAPDSNPVFECLPFLSGYTWGPVETADVQIAGEKASAVAIQAIGTTTPVPIHCSDFGSSSDTLQTLGANGLLGVGLFAQDCGSGCPTSIYYECPAAGCFGVAASLAEQVVNPVAFFSIDNNGVIVELPAVSGGEASVSGSLVFGIGTQSNNALGGAKVYTSDDFGNFTTSYNGQSYPGSFIDSGSNGFYFQDSATTGIPECSDAPGFYCPANTVNVSATNEGINNVSGSVTFNVANSDTLFGETTDFVYGDLGGEFSGSFDWGLPFFYGRNVFVAIQGASTPGGAGPYWAY
jgi:hypothetical protein